MDLHSRHFAGNPIKDVLVVIQPSIRREGRPASGRVNFIDGSPKQNSLVLSREGRNGSLNPKLNPIISTTLHLSMYLLAPSEALAAPWLGSLGSSLSKGLGSGFRVRQGLKYNTHLESGTPTRPR